MRNQFLRNFVQRIFIGVRDRGGGAGGATAPQKFWKTMEIRENAGKKLRKFGQIYQKIG
jgi:hypothetical protein